MQKIISLLGLAVAVMLLAGAMSTEGPEASAPSSGGPVEILAYGTSFDGVRLAKGADADTIYVVPAGRTLVVTDIDVAAAGLALLRKRGYSVEQVALVQHISVNGRGQSFRSYVTGIRFEAGDEVAIDPTESDVEWVALRGLLVPTHVE